MISVPSIEELRLHDPGDDTPSETALVAGYHVPGDDGGGLFTWVPKEQMAQLARRLGLICDDGGIWIRPAGAPCKISRSDGKGTIANPDRCILADSTLTRGGWRRLHDGIHNVRWFGAVGDGKADDSNAFEDAMSIFRYLDPVSQRPPLFVPSGSYRLTRPVGRASYLNNYSPSFPHTPHVSAMKLFGTVGQSRLLFDFQLDQEPVGIVTYDSVSLEGLSLEYRWPGHDLQGRLAIAINVRKDGGNARILLQDVQVGPEAGSSRGGWDTAILLDESQICTVDASVLSGERSSIDCRGAGGSGVLFSFSNSRITGNPPVSAFDVRNVSFENCYFQNDKAATLLRVNSVQPLIYNNCSHERGGGAGPRIIIEGQTSAEISNSSFFCNGSWAIEVSDRATLHPFKFVGNSVTGAKLGGVLYARGADKPPNTVLVIGNEVKGSVKGPDERGEIATRVQYLPPVFLAAANVPGKPKDDPRYEASAAGILSWLNNGPSVSPVPNPVLGVHAPNPAASLHVRAWGASDKLAFALEGYPHWVPKLQEVPKRQLYYTISRNGTPDQSGYPGSTITWAATIGSRNDPANGMTQFPNGEIASVRDVFVHQNELIDPILIHTVPQGSAVSIAVTAVGRATDGATFGFWTKVANYWRIGSALVVEEEHSGPPPFPAGCPPDLDSYLKWLGSIAHQVSRAERWYSNGALPSPTLQAFFASIRLVIPSYDQAIAWTLVIRSTSRANHPHE